MVCHDMEVVLDYAKIVLRLMGAALPLTTAMRFIPVFMNEMSAVSAEVRGFYLRGINSGYKSYGFGAMDFAAVIFTAVIIVLAVLY